MSSTMRWATRRPFWKPYSYDELGDEEHLEGLRVRVDSYFPDTLQLI
jgi:hypothetical protein